MNKFKRKAFIEKLFYSTKRKKFLLGFLVLFFFAFISLAYGLLQSKLKIQSRTTVAWGGIKIVNVAGPQLNGSSSSFSFDKTALSVVGNINGGSSSYIKYAVTVENRTENNVLLLDIEDDLPSGISYQLDGISFGSNVESRDSVTFNVIIKNNGSTAVSFNSTLNFVFENYTDITAPTITFDPAANSTGAACSNLNFSNKTVTVTATDDTSLKDFKYCTTTGQNASCTPTTTVSTVGYRHSVSKQVTLSGDSNYNVICASATDMASRKVTVCSNKDGKYYAIDKTKPVWSYVSKTNSNTPVTSATKNSVVTVTFKGTDVGCVHSTLTASNITVKVGGVTVTPTTKTLSSATNITNGVQYTLTLSGINSLGSLTLVIGANTLSDGGNSNIATTLTPGVTYVEPILKQFTSSSTDTFKGTTYKERITKAYFTTSNRVPSNATTSWDVSAEGNGSVRAWLISNDDISGGGYDLYIGGDGCVYANANSSYLFYGMTNLRTISNMANFYTSRATSMSSMFEGCSSLTSVDLSSSITSNVTSMTSMFYGCSNLSSITFGGSFSTANVEDMFCMFYGCSKLTNLDLSSFNTANVTRMSFMFVECSKLTGLNLSSFNTAKVNSMSSMFYGCSNLTGLNLSSFNTAKVNSMSSMFRDCSSLTSVDLSNFDTSNVADMSSMFHVCSSLTSLNLSNFDTSNVTNMSSMFHMCSSLTSLDLSSFNTSNVTNMSNMFYGCKDLTYLNLKSFVFTSVTSYTSIFVNCGSTSSPYTIVRVKDETAQTWVLSKGESYRPSGWTTENVIYGGIMQEWASGTTTDFHSSTYKTKIKNVTFATDNTVPSSGVVTWWDISKDKDGSVKAWIKNNSTSGYYDLYIGGEAGCVNFSPNASYMFDGFTALNIVSFNATINTAMVTNMSYMFKNCSSLYSINIQYLNTSNVTNMNHLFYECSSLGLSGSLDTSKVTDMSYMFYNCRSLQTNHDHSNGFQFYEMDTSNVTNMSHMFDGCSSLNYLDASFNTSKVTSMSYMFHGCSGLTDLSVSNFNTANVQYMTYMFYGCSNLSSLNLSNFNTSKVSNMQSMFSHCTKLTTLTLGSNFTTANVENMSYMFAYCNALTSLDLSKFNTAKVMNMSSMFRDCKKLANLKVSNFDTSSVTNMTYMFYYCSALTELDLSSFSTAKVTDMSYMFQYCTSMTRLNIKKFTFTSVTSYSSMFSSCGVGNTNLPYVYVKNATTQTWVLNLSSTNRPSTWTTDNVIYGGVMKEWASNSTTDFHSSTYKTKIKKIYTKNTATIPSNKVASWDVSKDSDGSVMAWLVNSSTSGYYDLYIGADGGKIYLSPSASYMFYGFSAVTSMDLSNFYTSNVTSMYYMFRNCSSLTSLDLSVFNTTKVTNMSYTFYGCSALTSLKLSSFNTANVTTMSNMFYGCSALTSLSLSSFNTTKVNSMSYMFNNCSSLSSLNLSSFNTAKVTTMYQMFYGCSKLSYITFGSNFNTGIVETMNQMFRGCTKLVSLDLSTFNTVKVTNMYGMFYGCSGLSELDLSSFNTAKVTNMTYMFYDCKNLTYLDLKSFVFTSVTSYTSIFVNCGSTGSPYATVRVKDKTAQTWILSKSSSYRPSGWTTSNVIYGSEFNKDTLSQILRSYSGMREIGFVTQKQSYYVDTWNISSNSDNVIYVSRWTSSGTFFDIYTTDGSTIFFPSDSSSIFEGVSVGAIQFYAGSCNTHDVTNMSSMFKNSASSIGGLSSLDTSNVTNMSYMFYGCSELSGLDLSGFNTAKVTDMSYMFYGCSNLYWLDLSALDLCRVSNTSYMFNGCSSLTNLNLKSLTQSITTSNSSGMFTNMPSSAKVYVGSLGAQSSILALSSSHRPSSWNSDNVIFGSVMKSWSSGATTDFHNSTYKTKIKYITIMHNKSASSPGYSDGIIANWDVSAAGDNSVKAYLYSTNGKAECISSSQSYSPSTADLVSPNSTEFYHLYISGVDWVNLPANCSYMFDGFTNLEFVDGAPINAIGAKDFSYMFRNCSNLRFVFNGVNCSYNVTNMSSMFRNCSSLPGFPSLDTTNVTNMSYMFDGCSKIVSKTCYYDTAKVEDMSYMFNGCSSLTSLNLGDKFSTYNVTNMSYMFNGCKSLTSLDLGNSFITYYVKNMSYMFSGCSSLTSLILGSLFNTYTVTNMSYMFRNCSSLTELDLSTFNTAKVTNMSYMFYNCTNLTYLYINNFTFTSVTSYSFIFTGVGTSVATDHHTYYPYVYVKDAAAQNWILNLSSSNRPSTWTTGNVLYGRVMKSWSSGATTDFHSSTYRTKIKNIYTKNSVTIPSNTVASWDVSRDSDGSVMAWVVNSSTSGYYDLYIGSDGGKIILSPSASYMFSGFSAVTSMDLSNFDTSDVTNMSYMFNGCIYLTYLYINNFTFTSVSSYTYIFAGVGTSVGADYHHSYYPYVYVKDATAQNWILNLSSSNRPSTWTSSNVMIRG